MTSVSTRPSEERKRGSALPVRRLSQTSRKLINTT